MKYHVLVFAILSSLYSTTHAASEAVDQPDNAQSPPTQTLGVNRQNKPNINELTKKSDLATPAPDVTSSLLQVTLGLFVVLIVIAGAAWFARRFGHFNMAAKGNLRIVGGLSLGSRERIVLMQVGEQQILVGVAPGRINTLHVLETPIKLDEPTEFHKPNLAGAFGAILKKVQKP